MNKRLSLAALAATLALTGWGCQNPIDAAKDKVSQKIGESVAEKIAEKATGGKVDINNNTASFKDEKTGDFQSYGEDLTVPADFTSELKKLDGAKVSHYSGKGDKSQYLLIQTLPDADGAKIATTVEDQLKANGYTRTTDASYGGAIMRNYEKDKNTITVMVNSDTSGDTPQTLVTMTLNVKTSE
ncbi:MAG: hypothetical protein U0487_02270 [Patescibacteria group bacterium]